MAGTKPVVRDALKPNVTALLRHPLTIVAVTTVLSSFVIPLLAHRSDVRQQRLRRALDILDRDMEVNRRLNSLLTTLEIFHKDNSGVAARLGDYRQEQRELRKTMAARYVEFDNVAWWWYQRLPTEASILGLTSPAETARVTDLMRRYEANLVKNTQVLNDLWNAFLREEYRPTDTRNTELMTETRKQLEELAGQRMRLVQALAELLASR
jgi:hypothetical protein